MKAVILIVIVFCSTAIAQRTFEIADASKFYNVKLEVAGCEEVFCRGKAVFSITKKGEGEPLQTIEIENIEFMLEEARLSDTKLVYDYQSVIFFEDYNFDGTNDLAVREGFGGGYGSPSYQILLFDQPQGKFVLDTVFTEMVQEGMGIVSVDKKRKMLTRFSKSGCCWHQTEGFSVVNGKPLKTYELTEDATMGNGTNGEKVKITTRKLINGKWRTWIKHVKAEN